MDKKKNRTDNYWRNSTLSFSFSTFWCFNQRNANGDGLRCFPFEFVPASGPNHKVATPLWITWFMINAPKELWSKCAPHRCMQFHYKMEQVFFSLQIYGRWIHFTLTLSSTIYIFGLAYCVANAEINPLICDMAHIFNYS